jgi:peptide/nickel transport system substrate-binding protein
MEMRMTRRITGLVAAGLAGMMALAACSPPDSDEPREPGEAMDLGFAGCEDNPDTCNTGPVEQGGEFTMLISLPFETWTPIRSGGNTVYVAQAWYGIYPRIGTYLPSGEWQWEMDYFESEPEVINDDPQTMVYRIREDAVWHDGTPMTVDDWIYSWYNYAGDKDLCEGCEPPSTAAYGLVESVEGSDDGKTVTITLKDGVNNPEWQSSYSGIFPAHEAEKAGFDWRNDPEAMGESTVWFTETMPTWSGGPWRIEDGTLTERVVKVPNENYWGVQPNLDRIVGEVVADPGSWVPALRNRDLDGGSPATFDVDVFRELANVDNIHYSAGSAGAVWEHIDIMTEHEYLSDLELRRAIFTAIDLEHVTTAIWGDDVPVNQRLNHTFSQLSPYFEDHRTATGFGTGSVEDARAILEAAGYTGAEAGGTLTTPDGDEVPPLRYRWTTGNTVRANTGELVQDYLAEIGITIELAPSDDLSGMLQSGDYDLVQFGWSGSPTFVQGLTQLWTTGSPSNFSSVDNEDINRLAAEAQRQVDIDDAAALGNQLSEILMNEAVVLPLWDSPAFDFVSADFANMRPNHNSGHRMNYNLTEWGVLAAN